MIRFFSSCLLLIERYASICHQELNLADRDFRRILDKMFEVKLRRQSLEQLRARLADGVAVVSMFPSISARKICLIRATQSEFGQPNALDAMEEAVDKELTRYKSQTSRKKYLTSEAYSDFRSLLWVRWLFSCTKASRGQFFLSIL